MVFKAGRKTFDWKWFTIPVWGYFHLHIFIFTKIKKTLTNVTQKQVHKGKSYFMAHKTQQEINTK